MDPIAVDIRPLVTRAELQACVELQHATWGERFSDAVPVSILKVVQRVGGVAAGAFDAHDALLGFVFGITGIERGRIVHWSDMLAVRPDARNLGVGKRLKEFQRRVARELGASLIYWTYDPLIARNAHLNFNRLGVRAAEYAIDMYGMTDSVLHGGLPTDRLVVAWPTHDDEIRALLDVSRCALSSKDCLRAPVVTAAMLEAATLESSPPPCLRVEIPLDAERMLSEDRSAAREWRFATRRALQAVLAAGYDVSAVALDDPAQRGYYLMTRSRSPIDGGTL